MKKTSKLKWILLLIPILYWTNHLIIQPYRSALSEIKIQQNIITHYQLKQQKFQTLINFVDSLPIFGEIDFESDIAFFLKMMFPTHLPLIR